MKTKFNYLSQDKVRKVDSLHFDSLQDLFDQKHSHEGNHKTSRSIMRRGPMGGRRRSGMGKSHWLGVNEDGSEKVFSDIFNDTMHGDPVLLEKLQGMISEMGVDVDENMRQQTSMLKKRKRKKSWQAFGDELDIHRVNSGRIDTAWRSTRMEEQDKIHHHITLFVDIGVHSGMPSENTLWRAAVAVHVCDKLIAAGKTVKIIVGNATKGLLQRDEGRTITTTVTVKDYNEPLSLERLAVMSNARFLRTIHFIAMSMHPMEIKSHFGYPSTWCQDNAPIDIEEEGEGVKYVYLGHADSISAAKASIESINSKWGSSS